MIDADKLITGQNTDSQNAVRGRILTSSTIYTRASSIAMDAAHQENPNFLKSSLIDFERLGA
jgi:hypothetical protein